MYVKASKQKKEKVTAFFSRETERSIHYFGLLHYTMQYTDVDCAISVVQLIIRYVYVVHFNIS